MTDAIEPLTDTVLPEEREEAVVTALLSGRSVNQVRKEFGGLSLDQIDRIIANAWPVDQRARVRMVMQDCGKLDRLISEFYRRALLAQDATAAAYATVAIRGMERKHELTGMSAATRIDLQVVTEPKPALQGFDKVREVIMRVARRGEAGANGANGSDPAVGMLPTPEPPPDDAEPSN